jgi:hypothetical protein
MDTAVSRVSSASFFLIAAGTAAIRPGYAALIRPERAAAVETNG